MRGRKRYALWIYRFSFRYLFAVFAEMRWNWTDNGNSSLNHKDCIAHSHAVLITWNCVRAVRGIVVYVLILNYYFLSFDNFRLAKALRNYGAIFSFVSHVGESSQLKVKGIQSVVWKGNNMYLTIHLHLLPSNFVWLRRAQMTYLMEQSLSCWGYLAIQIFLFAGNAPSLNCVLGIGRDMGAFIFSCNLHTEREWTSQHSFSFDRTLLYHFSGFSSLDKRFIETVPNIFTRRKIVRSSFGCTDKHEYWEDISFCILFFWHLMQTHQHSTICI